MSKPGRPPSQLALAGYGGVIRYPNGLVEVGYRFALGRVVGIETDEPAGRRQVAIERVVGKGTWRCRRPAVRYVPPRRDEDDQGGEWSPSPVWFRQADLHPCAGITFVNGSTRERLSPELFGVRLDERVVLKLAPNGAFAKYEMRGEWYLTPEEIWSLLRLGVPAESGAAADPARTHRHS